MIQPPIEDKSVIERHSFMGVTGYWVENLSFSIGDDTLDNHNGSVKVIGIDSEFRWITKEEFETVVRVLRLDR